MLSQTSPPLPHRQLALHGGEHGLAYGAVILARMTTEPLVKRVRHVLYLKISHVMTLSCFRHDIKTT